jgi:hypothetical protein
MTFALYRPKILRPGFFPVLALAFATFLGIRPDVAAQTVTDSSSSARGTEISPRPPANDSIAAQDSVAPARQNRRADGPFLHRVVPPGRGPQPLTATQKFELSIHSRVGFGAVGSSIFGAGERQLFNSRPHYGTDSGAFGERLGAAELKQVTESFFSYGLYAAAFHEDPHYYVMGPGNGHSIAHRAVYSATRLVLTRTDDGHTGINWAKLAGMGSATALTNAYYPPQDRGFGKTMSAYGASLASSVLTLELHEFMPDIKRAIFHHHRAAQ